MRCGAASNGKADADAGAGAESESGSRSDRSAREAEQRKSPGTPFRRLVGVRCARRCDDGNQRSTQVFVLGPPRQCPVSGGAHNVVISAQRWSDRQFEDDGRAAAGSGHSKMSVRRRVFAGDGGLASS